MLVRLTIETTHLDARGNHSLRKYRQVHLCEDDILEGQNWKHLDSGQGPELVCMRENILEDSVTGIFLLVHDEPGHWVVERAANGVPGQA